MKNLPLIFDCFKGDCSILFRPKEIISQGPVKDIRGKFLDIVVAIKTMKVFKNMETIAPCVSYFTHQHFTQNLGDEVLISSPVTLEVSPLRSNL